MKTTTQLVKDLRLAATHSAYGELLLYAAMRFEAAEAVMKKMSLKFSVEELEVMQAEMNADALLMESMQAAIAKKKSS